MGATPPALLKTAILVRTAVYRLTTNVPSATREPFCPRFVAGCTNQRQCGIRNVRSATLCLRPMTGSLRPIPRHDNDLRQFAYPDEMVAATEVGEQVVVGLRSFEDRHPQAARGFSRTTINKRLMAA